MCELALLAEATLTQVLKVAAEDRLITIVEALVAARRHASHIRHNLSRVHARTAHHHNWGRGLRHHIHRRVKSVLSILGILLIH